MRRNAALLGDMFRKRGFTVETQQVASGSPVVLATLDVAPSSGTLTLYIHYDGQEVDSTEWTKCGPFAPCVMAPGGKVTLDASVRTFDPDGRIYARSASDDKGPIMAVLAAMDALRATGGKPAWNLRVVLDGRRKPAPRTSDASLRRRATSSRQTWPSRSTDRATERPTDDVLRCPRGAGVTITVFTSRNDLQRQLRQLGARSVHALGRLLGSMKDSTGRSRSRASMTMSRRSQRPRSARWPKRLTLKQCWQRNSAWHDPSAGRHGSSRN
jgi:hypothetical protein